MSIKLGDQVPIIGVAFVEVVGSDGASVNWQIFVGIFVKVGATDVLKVTLILSDEVFNPHVTVQV